jgi:hypothetical protein
MIMGWMPEYGKLFKVKNKLVQTLKECSAIWRGVILGEFCLILIIEKFLALLL